MHVIILGFPESSRKRFFMTKMRRRPNFDEKKSTKVKSNKMRRRPDFPDKF